MLVAASALIFVLTIYAVLLHGTIANQAVRIARLEQRLACVEVMEAARARRAVECN